MDSNSMASSLSTAMRQGSHSCPKYSAHTGLGSACLIAEHNLWCLRPILLSLKHVNSKISKSNAFFEILLEQFFAMTTSYRSWGNERHCVCRFCEQPVYTHSSSWMHLANAARSRKHEVLLAPCRFTSTPAWCGANCPNSYFDVVARLLAAQLYNEFPVQAPLLAYVVCPDMQRRFVASSFSRLAERSNTWSDAALMSVTARLRVESVLGHFYS